MKDYLIKFNADGRRGTTYADGVHYNVNPDGSVTDGTVKVKDLLEAGYIFVDADDYSNLLGNNPERQEYCRKEDGSFVTYVPPEPTDEEKAAVEKAALKAEYESGKKELLGSLQSATLAGNTDAVASIQAEFKDFSAAYKAAFEEVK